MKDKKLEEQFKGYFEGMELPDTPNITDDAKKQLKKRQSKLPRVAAIASIAASFGLVVAVGAVMISRLNFNLFNPDKNPPDANIPNITTYKESEVEYVDYSPYVYTSSKIDPTLKFIENLAYTGNAQVNGLYIAKFGDDSKAFAYATVSVLDETRHDTEIFVEYAQATFEPLKDYNGGTKHEYKGLAYYLTTEVDETGEPVNKLLVTYDGVKYYFKITSSDTDSYLKYLQMFG